MSARHYKVEYTEDDANYTLLAADEVPGPGKTQTVTGLAAGTHTGKLRLSPLSGESPVSSLPFTFQVGVIPMSEPVQATATASVTIADVMAVRDNLLAAIGVTATVDDTQTGIVLDNVSASATVQASQTDTVTMPEPLSTTVSTLATIADVRAMLESVLAAATAQATVADSYTAAAGTAPATPTQSALTIGDGQLTANWSNVTGETSYTVYYSRSALLDANYSDYISNEPDPPTPVDYPVTPNATAGKISGIAADSIAQVITGLTNGATYYVGVSATNASGTSALSAIQSAAPVVIGPAPTVPVTDNFDRTDSTSLGTNWVKPSWASSSLKIVSNKATGQTSGSYGNVQSTSLWNTTVNTFTPDQFAEATFPGIGTYDASTRIIVRGSASTETYYALISTGLIYKVVAGANRNIAFSNQVAAMGAITATDVFRLSVQGLAPAVLRIYKNGSLIATVNDPISPITSGQPGLSGGNAANDVVDNFSAGQS